MKALNILTTLTCMQLHLRLAPRLFLPSMSMQMNSCYGLRCTMNCLALAGQELLSNLVFEFCWSCGDLAGFGGFNTVFERDACDDFGEVVKAA